MDSRLHGNDGNLLGAFDLPSAFASLVIPAQAGIHRAVVWEWVHAACVGRGLLYRPMDSRLHGNDGGKTNVLGKFPSFPRRRESIERLWAHEVIQCLQRAGLASAARWQIEFAGRKV